MAVSEKEGQKRELTRRGSHESDLMLREYSWTHWVITTPILISSFSICCQTASLRNKETEQLRGKWIHFKDAEAADKWKSSCRRRNECWQKQQNKLQGRVLFHLHVCLSDRWLWTLEKWGHERRSVVQGDMEQRCCDRSNSKNEQK